MERKGMQRGFWLVVSWVAAAAALLALAALPTAAERGRRVEQRNEERPLAPPTSQLTCPLYANDIFYYHYCASSERDLTRVELWRKHEGGDWGIVGIMHFPSGIQSICEWVAHIPPTEPEGLHAYESVAHDVSESEPRMGGEGECGVIVDYTTPTGSTSAPDYGRSPTETIVVEWSAWDNPAPSGGTTSDLHLVQLWTNYAGGGWAFSGQQVTATGTMTGTFSYPPGGDGEYCFDAVASDWATNQEELGNSIACTKQDTAAPTLVITSPAVSSQPSWQVDWHGMDPSPSSGIALYDVEYRVGANPLWVPWLTGVSVTSTLFGPDTPVSVVNGQDYAFRGRASDLAGNQGSYCAPSLTLHDALAGRINLPLVLNRFATDAYEENDTLAESYGPLISGQVYRAFPDDQRDYYYIQLPITGTVLIEVWDYAPTTDLGSMQLLDKDGNLILHFGTPGQTTMTIQSGTLPWHDRFHVRVYTEEAGYTTSELYALRVTY